MRPLPEKTCAGCGRRITWRKKWERVWEAVRYCSDACRSRDARSDDALEKTIKVLLAERPRDETICPSEAARRVAGDADWRPLMQPARDAARRLIAAGEIEMTQRGVVVDPSTARGPVRLRRASRSTER